VDRKGSRREELKIKGKQYHYFRSKITSTIKNLQKKDNACVIKRLLTIPMQISTVSSKKIYRRATKKDSRIERVCELQNVAGGVSYVRCTKTAAESSRERKTATYKSGSREVQSLNLRAQDH